MHISSIGAGAGGGFCSRTCRVLSSDDIMPVWSRQIKPNNTIIQEQALLCESFLGHLVCWACTRRGCGRMEPSQQSFLLTCTCSQPQTSSHTSRFYLSVPLNFRNTHTHTASLCLCGLILGSASVADCWLQSCCLSFPFTRGCTTVRFHADKHNLFPQFVRQ